MSKPIPPEPREVELVDPSYQPSKAELAEEFDFSDLEARSLEDVARAVLRPVRVRHIPRPRSVPQ